MDIDKYVAMLGALELPELDRLNGPRLARLARDDQRQARLLLSLSMVMALFVGLAGGAGTPVEAKASAVPFGPPMMMTPLLQLARG